MYFIGVSSRIASQAGPADKLPHGRAPVGERRPEMNNEEEQVVTRADRLFQGSIRFSCNPFLPISSNRSPAPSGNDHREPVVPAAVAPVQELCSPAINPCGRGEQLPDVAVPAESVLPRKVSSHPRP